MKRVILGFALILFCFFVNSNFIKVSFAEDINLSSFSELYETMDTTSVSPNIPEYGLPLVPSQIVNYYEIFQLSDYWYELLLPDWAGPPIILASAGDTMQVLLDQGFVVAHLKYPGLSFVDIYKKLKKQNIPIFITSDSLLHLYHVQFERPCWRWKRGNFMGICFPLHRPCTLSQRPGMKAAPAILRKRPKGTRLSFQWP